MIQKLKHSNQFERGVIKNLLKSSVEVKKQVSKAVLCKFVRNGLLKNFTNPTGKHLC